MNAGNLSPRHVEWVADQLSEWCAPLRLNIESSTVTSFYVDLGSRTGLKRRGPEPLEGRVVFLDTRPLHAVLMQNVVMLEQKVRNDPHSKSSGAGSRPTRHRAEPGRFAMCRRPATVWLRR